MNMSPSTRRLLGYARRYRPRSRAASSASSRASAISLASPWVLKYAIDDLTRGVTLGKVASMRRPARARRRWRAVSFLTRRIIIGASRQFEYDLRNDFFAALQRLDLAYLQRNRTGDLMSRATNDLNAVRMMIGPAVMYTSSTALTFVVAIVADAVDRRAAHADRADPAAVRLAVGALLRVRHPSAVSAIQEELSDISNITQESLPACASCARIGRSRSRSTASARATRSTSRAIRTLIRLQGSITRAWVC
jgi:ATP-binding cassette subfamily B protein